MQIFGSKASLCLLKRIPLIFYLLHYVGCKTEFRTDSFSDKADTLYLLKSVVYVGCAGAAAAQLRTSSGVSIVT